MTDHTELATLLSTVPAEDIPGIIEEAKRQREKKWPMSYTLYVHGDEDSNWDTANEIGLSQEASEVFRGTAYELALEVEIREDGTCYLLGVRCGAQASKLVEPVGI